MYKLINTKYTDGTSAVSSVIRLFDNATIPFDLANTDYQNFKKEVLPGAELQDADENVMTDSAEYVRTLP